MIVPDLEQVIEWVQECDINDLGDCFVDSESQWITVNEQCEVHFRFIAYNWPKVRHGVKNENIS